MRLLHASPLLLLTLSCVALGCGGSEPKVESPAEGESAKPADGGTAGGAATAAPAAKAEETKGIPTTCNSNGKVCLLPESFVKKLCDNVHPDIALAYFGKGTPFTRGYLKGATEAWNASGGATSGEKFVFDEEVIVVRARENKTGIEVSGASGGYDVLRWDGSCATLSGEELTFSVAPKPKTAKIEWRYLSDATQAALLKDDKIAKINKTRRDECKGATMGDVSKKCVKAVDELGEAIAAYVRGGGEIPLPSEMK